MLTGFMIFYREIELALKRFSLFLVVLFLISAFLKPDHAVFAQEGTTYPTYAIQSGDTLGLIAIRFGVSVDDIIKINDLENPDALAIGTEIKIPGLEGISGKLETRVIKLGEDLHQLSLRTAISEQQIAKMNRLTSSGEVFAGTTLILTQPQSDDMFQPAGMVNASLTLLEKSLQFDNNFWAILNQNQIVHSWDILPSQQVFSFQSGQINPESTNQFELSPLPLVQGKTSQLTISNPIQNNISIKFNDQIIPAFSNNGGSIAFIGIPALMESGLYPLTITQTDSKGESSEFSQYVLVEPGAFIQESVTGVDSSTVDGSTIDQENQILTQYRSTNPNRLWNGSFQFPVDEPCFASTFGNRRSYNNGTYFYYHTGMDFTVCANNLNIYAAAPGTVIFAGNLPIKGNFTLIDHGWGIYTGYAHQVEQFIKVGDTVEKGQRIGSIGNTGRSLGPHLHWEVWVNGTPVDPLEWVEKSFPLQAED